MMGAAVLWGAGWPALKLLSMLAPTTEIMFFELLASSIFAVLLVCLRRRPLKDWKRLGAAASLGLVEPGAAYLFFALGIARTTATSATLIDALQPAVILLVARGFFREFVAPAIFPLIALALAATAVAVGSPSLANGWQLGGDALVALGMMVAAVHSVLMKRTFADIEPAIVAAAQQIAGVMVLGGAAILYGRLWHYTNLSAFDLLLVVVAGILTIAVPFMLYVSAVRRISGASVGIAIAFIPVSGVTLSAFVLREAISTVQIIGICVVVCALFAAAIFEGRFKFIPR